MEYRNTRTGAVISSPCVISGGDWVLIDTLGAELTVAEIKRKLDEKGIEYNPKAKKPELLALLGD